MKHINDDGGILMGSTIMIMGNLYLFICLFMYLFIHVFIIIYIYYYII